MSFLGLSHRKRDYRRELCGRHAPGHERRLSLQPFPWSRVAGCRWQSGFPRQPHLKQALRLS